MAIPKGLTKCAKCGEYRGRVQEKDLELPEKFLDYETENGLGFFDVVCICEGILCSVCNKKVIRKPNSNHYDEKSNDVWHTPHNITHPVQCRECNNPKYMHEEEAEKSFRRGQIFVNSMITMSKPLK